MKRNKWPSIYEWLRSLSPGTFVPWEELEQRTGHDRQLSRGVLFRSRQELERVDGLTVTGQCKEGFKVVSHGG